MGSGHFVVWFILMQFFFMSSWVYAMQCLHDYAIKCVVNLQMVCNWMFIWYSYLHLQVNVFVILCSHADELPRQLGGIDNWSFGLFVWCIRLCELIGTLEPLTPSQLHNQWVHFHPYPIALVFVSYSVDKEYSFTYCLHFRKDLGTTKSAWTSKSDASSCLFLDLEYYFHSVVWA